MRCTFPPYGRVTVIRRVDKPRSGAIHHAATVPCRVRSGGASALRGSSAECQSHCPLARTPAARAPGTGRPRVHAGHRDGCSCRGRPGCPAAHEAAHRLQGIEQGALAVAATAAALPPAPRSAPTCRPAGTPPPPASIAVPACRHAPARPVPAGDEGSRIHDSFLRFPFDVFFGHLGLCFRPSGEVPHMVRCIVPAVTRTGTGISSPDIRRCP